MNLRILKKLSKRAAPYLVRLGDHREQFLSVKDDNYHGLVIRERKHWERSRIHPSHTEKRDHEEIIYTSRRGHRIGVRNPWHPRKGTIMVGSIDGYYEPEWSEETAYGALLEVVHAEFTDWDAVMREDDSVPWSTRRLRTPHEVFAAAEDLLRQRDEPEFEAILGLSGDLL